MSQKKNWLEDWFSGSEKNKLIERLKAEDKELAELVRTWCNEIRGKLDESFKNFEQYTGHGAEHSEAMLTCLDWLIPLDVIDKMNALEIALLVLAVYHHDIGMAFDIGRKADLASDPRWLAAKDILIEKFRSSPTVNDKDYLILEKLAFVEWTRERHAEESVHWIQTQRMGNPKYYLGPRYFNGDPWEDVKELCRFHTEPSCDELDTERCAPAGLKGMRVNMCFLACALRLADECHITVDRADEQMAKSICFTDEFSRLKWRERQCVPSVGPDSNNRLLVIRASPPSTHFHGAVVSMGREIMEELERTNMTLEKNKSGYRFPWLAVDLKSQVKEGPYHYREWEYHLNPLRVCDLLLGEKLYGDRSVCIRELLQNAVDAVRAKWGSEAPKKGQITCRRLVKKRDGEDFEVIEIEDNGIGMDENIIETHLLTVPGDSFYRTSRYAIEHSAVSKSLNPIAQHGIGFLSSFMAAKTVEIFTQYYSPGERAKGIHAEPSLDKGVVYHKTPMIDFPQGVRDQGSGTCVRLWLKGKLTDWTCSHRQGRWNSLKEVVEYWVRRTTVPILVCDFDQPHTNACIGVTPSNAMLILDDTMGISGYIDMSLDYDSPEAKETKELEVTVSRFHVERHPFMKDKLGLWFPKGELDFSGNRDFSLTVDRKGFQEIESSKILAKAKNLLIETATNWIRQQPDWNPSAKHKLRKLLLHQRVLGENEDLRKLIMTLPIFRAGGENTDQSINDILEERTYLFIPILPLFRKDAMGSTTAQHFSVWYNEIVQSLRSKYRLLYTGQIGKKEAKDSYVVFAARSKHLQRYPLHLLDWLCNARLEFVQEGWPLLRLLVRDDANLTHGWSRLLDYEPDKKDWLICSTDGEAHWINPHCLAKKVVLGNEGKIMGGNVKRLDQRLANRPADGFLYPYDQIIIRYEVDGKYERTEKTVRELDKIDGDLVYPFDRIDFWVRKFIDEEDLPDEEVDSLLRLLYLDRDIFAEVR